MVPEIKTLQEKKLTGMHLTMSLSANKTGELWRKFMPRRNEIRNRSGSDLISLQAYPLFYFSHFDPGNEFEKWAAAEVTDFDHVPAGMETFILAGGLHAVFHYKGLNTDAGIFHYIFGTWLPGSEYELSPGPHFEILGKNYRNNDPASEEEIWIPVKSKQQTF